MVMEAVIKMMDSDDGLQHRTTTSMEGGDRCPKTRGASGGKPVIKWNQKLLTQEAYESLTGLHKTDTQQKSRSGG